MMGMAAFFIPETERVPFSGLPPEIIIFPLLVSIVKRGDPFTSYFDRVLWATLTFYQKNGFIAIDIANVYAFFKMSEMPKAGKIILISYVKFEIMCIPNIFLNMKK